MAALYIINKDDASAYKITWLVLIAAVPFVGGVLYLFLGDKNEINLNRFGRKSEGAVFLYII